MLKVQKGYVLLLTLVFLIILTVLALSEASLNSTQTRVAANATATEVSFETAEGALNQAINYLLNGTYTPNEFMQNSNGLYTFDPTAPPLWTTVNWSSATAVINSFQGSGSRASYIIEQLPSVVQPGQNMKAPMFTYVYRITARVVNTSGNSSVILQTTTQVQE